jgi:hypothetical protein
MRITVEIDANTARRIQEATGQRQPSQAISHALDEFLRHQASRDLIKRAKSGQTDFAMTNDELEGRDVYQPFG